MPIINKQFKNKVKLWFYLYLESKKPAYQIWIMRLAIKVFGFIMRLPKSLFLVLDAEIKAGDFKGVFRREWWLSNQLVLKGKFKYDRYFDFSIGLTKKAAEKTYEKLFTYYENSGNVDGFDQQIYLAQLASASIDGDLLPSEDLMLEKQAFLDKDKQYIDHINKALSFLTIVDFEEAWTTKIQQKREKSDVKDSKESIKVSSQRNQFGQYAEVVFRDFIALFNSVEIPVFAISGTLLGMVRENAFLAHDYDIDMGIFDDVDFDMLLAVINNSQMFYVKKVDYPSFRNTNNTGNVFYHRMEKPALIKIGHQETGVHIDLFTHFKEGELVWHGSTLHRWDNTAFTLSTRNFLGIEVLIPANYDLYLTENYDDWRTPVTEFNCSTGTPNASVSTNPRTLCYYIKLSFDSFGNKEKYRYLIKMLVQSNLIKVCSNRYVFR